MSSIFIQAFTIKIIFPHKYNTVLQTNKLIDGISGKSAGSTRIRRVNRLPVDELLASMQFSHVLTFLAFPVARASFIDFTVVNEFRRNGGSRCNLESKPLWHTFNKNLGKKVTKN